MSKQLQITSFLKQVKEIEIQPDKTKKTNKCVHVHTQFYRDFLEENKNECQNESCVKAKNELNKNKEEIREKIRTIACVNLFYPTKMMK